ncbi:MAG: adenylate/guanylate cyclase domain-containing protein [Oscillatoria sp. PMC 1068.18]|nr:adenylate/guanylate cyclase domain-containing protein [Oscillatoria sp. PMC 1076.18]MEC4989636.1 adenylate/guanylate cyclase domain-containing protein [Oscillatoria sp. PMC 1068.18]
MLGDISSLINSFKARLSRQIVIWVFASIVITEIIILIPSYKREETRQLQQLEEISAELTDSIVRLSQQQMNPRIFAEKIPELTQGSEIIIGIALYNSQGKLVGIYGEAPALTFSDLKNADFVRQRSWNGKYYDVARSSQSLGIPYSLIIRHNAAKIQQILFNYTIRIALLVLLIAIVVTTTTMIVLGVTVIVPILRLRDDLMSVADALKLENEQPNFYSLKSNRTDELGEVMVAFNEMFERVNWEIKARKKTADKLQIEREKSEQLLLNILPEPIAEKLKQGEVNIAHKFSEVTILFADLVGFTELSARKTPEELVKLLNEIFSQFDSFTEAYQLEKIKTIGDAYMVAGGLPTPRPDHAEAIAEMALKMQAEMQKFSAKHGEVFKIRVGINTGEVVAGVIGTKKFIYDLWGDAVNTASRMESHGIPGMIQVSATTYEILQNKYEFKEQGCIPIKGKGKMMTYILLGKKAES